MNALFNQISYPVFLYLTFNFFLIASVFSFLVGVGLAIRSQRALAFFDYMNRWVSVRRMLKPLQVPHHVEPVLLQRPVLLGSSITVGAAVAIMMLQGVDLRPSLQLFEGSLTPPEMLGVAENFKLFLLVGNALCVVVGMLILFFPRALTTLESYTDHWYALRRSMLPLDKMHTGLDSWVLKHPTSVGIVLSILSFSVGMMMYSQLQTLS